MMRTSKAIHALLAKAKESDSYWVEDAKLDFSLALERARRRTGATYKALAEKLGTSQAYISKVFRGDANLTIESMVKLARATDSHLRIEVVDQRADAKRWMGTVIALNRNAANHPAIVVTEGSNVKGARGTEKERMAA